MEKKYIIVVNTGSASKKYALYSENRQLLSLYLEKIKGGYTINIETKDKKINKNITKIQYDDAFLQMLDTAKSLKILVDYKNIEAVGIRVVAPGTFFTKHRKIDVKYIQKLNAVKQTAPLHINVTISEIQSIQKILKSIKIYGVSDSVFHKDIPNHARIFALPYKDTQKFDMYRFGYHGISVQSVVREAQKSKSISLTKSIVCHLGGGSSITALRGGMSIDTTMGFTPDSGLPMSTRIGTIDATGIIILAKKLGGIKKLSEYLNTKSGLLGVSGLSGDMRELLHSENKGDENSKKAIELYIYHVKKNIGAFAVALEGINSIIFTGTIGERSSILRSRICESLGWLDLKLDNKQNNKIVDVDGMISAKSSKVKVFVICSREMTEIMRTVKKMSSKETTK